MTTQTSTDQTIAAMQAALENLTANYQTLDIAVIREIRGNAMDMGRAIMDADDFDHETFMRAYDLVIELDRVGY